MTVCAHSDISQLLEVSRLSMNFDPSLTVLAWKALGKLLCRVKGHLHDDWSIQPIIKELCVTMETKASECVQCAPTLTNEVSSNRSHDQSHDQSPPPLQQTPSPIFGKLLKLCRLLTTLLVKLVQVGVGAKFKHNLYLLWWVWPEGAKFRNIPVAYGRICAHIPFGWCGQRMQS